MDFRKGGEGGQKVNLGVFSLSVSQEPCRNRLNIPCSSEQHANRCTPAREPYIFTCPLTPSSSLRHVTYRPETTIRKHSHHAHTHMIPLVFAAPHSRAEPCAFLAVPKEMDLLMMYFRQNHAIQASDKGAVHTGQLLSAPLRFCEPMPVSG